VSVYEPGIDGDAIARGGREDASRVIVSLDAGERAMLEKWALSIVVVGRGFTTTRRRGGVAERHMGLENCPGKNAHRGGGARWGSSRARTAASRARVGFFAPGQVGTRRTTARRAGLRSHARCSAAATSARWSRRARWVLDARLRWSRLDEEGAAEIGIERKRARPSRSANRPTPLDTPPAGPETSGLRDEEFSFRDGDRARLLVENSARRWSFR